MPAESEPHRSLAKAANRDPVPFLVSRRQGAAKLDVSQSTWDRYVAAGLLPRAIRIGGASRWRWEEIEAAIDRLAAARDVAA